MKEIPASRRIQKSRRITRRLVRLPVFKKARHILAYMPLPDEVATEDFILEALKQGKTVYLPRVDRHRRTLSICPVLDLKGNLCRGAFGIWEPKPPGEKLRGASRGLDLVIAPGLGFDSNGARLGRGGGYFDRFFAKASRAYKIGIAFREQRLRSIPVSRHDVRMDAVVTD